MTSSEPQLAATNAMPVTANGSERPASKNCFEVLLARRRRSPISRMKEVCSDDGVVSAFR